MKCLETLLRYGTERVRQTRTYAHTSPHHVGHASHWCCCFRVVHNHSLCVPADRRTSPPHTRPAGRAHHRGRRQPTSLVVPRGICARPSPPPPSPAHAARPFPAAPPAGSVWASDCALAFASALSACWGC